MDRVARRVVRSNAAFAMRWWVLLLVALCEVSSGLQPAAFRSVSRHHRVRQLAMGGEEEVSRAAPAAAPPRQARVLRQGAGIFAPVVLQAKKSFGVNEINALRAKVIAEHTKVIAKFVDTSESPFGRSTRTRPHPRNVGWRVWCMRFASSSPCAHQHVPVCRSSAQGTL